MKFLHSMIRVKNLEDSIKFYTELFGLKEEKTIRLEDCSLHFLGDGSGAQIELTYNNETPQNGYENGNAFGHFAFQTSDFKEFSSKMNELGYSYLYEPFYLEGAGSTIAFVKDPDGNEIEIIESK